MVSENIFLIQFRTTVFSVYFLLIFNIELKQLLISIQTILLISLFLLIKKNIFILLYSKKPKILPQIKLYIEKNK